MKKIKVLIITLILLFILFFFLKQRNPKLCITLMDTTCDSLHFNILIDNETIFNDYIENEWYKNKEIYFKSSFGKHNIKIIVDEKTITDTSIYVIFNDIIDVQLFSKAKCKKIELSINNKGAFSTIFYD